MTADSVESTDAENRSRWPTYQPMVLVTVSFALGIFLDRTLDMDWRISAALSGASLLVWFCIRQKMAPPTISITPVNPHHRRRLASTLLLVCLVFAGAFWHHGRWNWFGVSEIGRFAGDVPITCCVDVTVISEPRWIVVNEDAEEDGLGDKTRTRLVVRVNRIRDGKQWIQTTGTADLVIHLATKHVASGDRVRVFGRLVGSSPPSNPGQFDFGNYYRASSKLAFIHAYDVRSVVVLKTGGWLGSRVLSSLRHRLNEITWRYVGKHEAGFAAAILLGNREQLSRPRRESFLETGTVHLLAISGLHVGILASSFFLFFRLGLLSRRKCLIATIVFVIFYAWLVEFRPPVSRAAILIILFCIGRLVGESNFSFNLLAIAGMIVLLINPSDLFGIGPQLSFLAVATLTFGSDWIFWPPSQDPINRLIASTRPWHVRCFNWIGRQLRTAFLVSGLIWMVAMPLVAFRFHLVAPISLLINPLLLIPIAWGLYAGLGVLVFGWFLPPAATVCGWICGLNLGLIEWMIGIAQSITLGHGWTAGPPAWSLFIFYAGVLVFAIYPPTRVSGRGLAAMAIGWLVFAWLVPDQVTKMVDRRTESDLVCTVIDVGHGSSVLLQLPNGKNVLYDAGSFGSETYGARSIAGVLWSERIEHLDAVILSHADVDHFNALPYLVEQFSIGAVHVSPLMRKSKSPAVQDMFAALKKHSVPVNLVSAGDNILDFKSAELKIISPSAVGNSGNDNSNSLVLLVQSFGRKILLPGDLEQEGLDRLFESSPIDCDMVMAAHHGSKNSQPEKFMAWSTPEFVVISGGSHRVSERVVERFSSSGEDRRIARTDQDGAVRLTVAPDGEMGFESWIRNPW